MFSAASWKAIANSLDEHSAHHDDLDGRGVSREPAQASHLHHPSPRQYAVFANFPHARNLVRLCGYWFYVTGKIQPGKNPEAVLD